MALAARPSTVPSADPRTACPVCGGVIHPIAGRCKHCKTDLVKLRKQQAAAAAAQHASDPFPSPFARPRPQAAPMPAPMARPLTGAAPAPATAAGSSPTTALSAPAPVAHAPSAPMPAPAMPDLYAPPPPVVRQSAWSRWWPIIVAVIAAAAIIVSLFLLVTGGHKDGSRTPHMGTTPAPDRMNTDPLSQNDPWQSTQPPPGAQGNTSPPQAEPPPPPPDPSQQPPSQDPPPPDDPSLGSLGGGSSGGVGGGVIGGTGGSNVIAPAPEKFNAAMFETVCKRLKTCGTLAPQLQQVCDELAQMAAFANDDSTKRRVDSGECTYDRGKASSCLDMLSHVPCSSRQIGLDDVTRIITGFASCEPLQCH